MNVKATVPIANAHQVNPSGDPTKENDKRGALSERRKPKGNSSTPSPTPPPESETSTVKETELPCQILDSEKTLDLINSTPHLKDRKKFAVARFVVGKNSDKRH